MPDVGRYALSAAGVAVDRRRRKPCLLLHADCVFAVAVKGDVRIADRMLLDLLFKDRALLFSILSVPCFGLAGIILD